MTLDEAKALPSYCFWQDALRTLVTNISIALRAAGKPVTRDNMIRFARDVPHCPEQIAGREWQEHSFCNECLRLAFPVQKPQNCGTTNGDLYYYFLIFIPNLPYHARHMLIETVAGILGALELDKE